jgi:hypothetical protein
MTLHELQAMTPETGHAPTGSRASKGCFNVSVLSLLCTVGL